MTKTDRSAFAPRSLVLAFLVLAAFLLALATLAQRLGTASRRTSVASARPDPGVPAPQPAPARPAAPAAEAPRVAAAPVPAANEPRAEPTGPATISGRLVLDGFAPFRGTVSLAERGGDWSAFAEIDAGGRFYLEDVPPGTVELSFGAEASQERILLLPEVAVDTRAGEIAFVDLDWHTRHVNVQVLEESGRGPARLTVQGPGYDREVATNELGKAPLALVGSGLFTFRSRMANGLVSEEQAELDEAEELDSVVLTARSVAAR